MGLFGAGAGSYLAFSRAGWGQNLVDIEYLLNCYLFGAETRRFQ